MKLNEHKDIAGNQYCKKLPPAITSITHTTNHIKQYSQPITKDTFVPNALCINPFIFTPGNAMSISAIALITIRSNKPANNKEKITAGPAIETVSEVPLNIPALLPLRVPSYEYDGAINSFVIP
jgi:hypothetical protein